MKIHILFLFTMSLLHVAWAQEKTRRTNNDSIDWDELEISYEVKKVTIHSDSIFIGSKRRLPAISVNIPESDAGLIRVAWQKAVKNKTRSKFLTEDGVESLMGTVVDPITSEPINVYTMIVKQEGSTKVVASYELSGKILSDSYRLKNYQSARAFMLDFGEEQYYKTVERQVKDARKSLRKTDERLRKLRMINKQLHAKLETNKTNVVNIEEEIADNHGDIKAKREEISVKKESMVGFSGELRHKKEQEINVLDRERKKLQSMGKAMGRKLVRYRANIEATDEQIKSNLSEQELQKIRVDRRLSRLKSLEEKLVQIE